jgi:hypothetical protein
MCDIIEAKLFVCFIKHHVMTVYDRVKGGVTPHVLKRGPIDVGVQLYHHHYVAETSWCTSSRRVDGPPSRSELFGVEKNPCDIIRSWSIV